MIQILHSLKPDKNHIVPIPCDKENKKTGRYVGWPGKGKLMLVVLKRGPPDFIMNNRFKRNGRGAGRCRKGLCSDLSKSRGACCGMRRGDVTLNLMGPQPHTEGKRKELATEVGFRIRQSV